MLHHSRFTTAALVGIVTVGSFAGALATSAPALAADHHGGYASRDRGHVDMRRDDHRDYGRRYDRGYVEPAPAYVYQAPAYPYPYPAYGYAPSGGYVHVRTPGFSLGFGF